MAEAERPDVTPNELVLILGLLPSMTVLLLLFGQHAQRRLADLRGEPPAELVRTKPRALPKELLTAAERVEKENPTPPDDPPLGIGDECYLLDGNEPAPMLVVAVNDTHVVASWAEGSIEQKFARTIVRRYKHGGRRGDAKAPRASPSDAGLAKRLPVT